MEWDVTAYLNTIDWEKRLSQEVPLLEEIIGMYGKGDGMRILDLGCGPGKHLSILAKTYPKHEFHGIDIDERMINHTRDNEIKGAGNVELHLGDVIEGTSSLTGKFDVIYSLGNTLSLMWGTGDINNIVESLTGLLSRNGLLFFQVLNTEKPRSGYFTSKITKSLDGSEIFTLKRFQPDHEPRIMNFEFSVLSKREDDLKFSINTQNARWSLIPIKAIWDAMESHDVVIKFSWSSYQKAPFIKDESDNLLCLGRFQPS